MGRAIGETGTVLRQREQASRTCQVWGVLNVTPDSFSDGGLYLRQDAALGHARDMLAAGADVIDIGGASSRPQGRLYGAGAPAVSADEETGRILPLVRAVTEEFSGKVSIDTTRAEVARVAIAAGASIVNDVSCAASRDLLTVVAESGVEYVIMHTRGAGEVEPPNTIYSDVVVDVLAELRAGIARATEAGIARDRLWLDPGLGFAKTAEQSLTLLAHTQRFVASGFRILCGPSRKGFIGHYAPRPDGGRPSAVERDPGTLAAVTAAVLQGASAVRVHDVGAARQAVLVAEALRQRVRAC